MSETTISESDLFEGASLPDAGVTIGENFYDDEHDELDGGPRDDGDAISAAVGAVGYMARHVVQDCKQTFPDGSYTEPEEFDRYYFAPGDRPYEGPAPILIDLLTADDPAEVQQERIDKHIEFKTAWCAKNGVRYVVLSDLDDLMLSTDALRARLMGDDGSPAEAPAAAESASETPQPAKKRRGVQRPRAEG